MRSLFHILVVAIGLLLALVGQAVAVGPATADAEKAIAADERALASARATVAAGGGIEVRALETRLRDIRQKARTRRGPIEADLRFAREALERLGPAPAADALPEDPAVARQRKEATAEAARLQGLVTRTTATFDGAGALLAEISRRRLAFLYASLGERGETLASPRLWRAAAADAARAFAAINAHFDGWARARPGRGPAGLALDSAILIIAAALAIFMIGPAHRSALRAFIRPAGPATGSAPSRAAIRMLARLAPALLGGGLMIAAVLATGLLPAGQLGMMRSAMIALAGAALANGFFGSRNLTGGLVVAAFVVYGLHLIILSAAETAGVGSDLTRLSGMLAASALGALLIAIAATRRQTADAEQQPAARQSLAAGLARIAPWIGAALIIAPLAGYSNLAEFLASRIFFLAGLGLLVWSLRGALRAAASGALARWRIGAGGRTEGSMASFWSGLTIDALLIFAFAPFVLILAGLSPERVRDMAAQAFFGFKVGGVTISVARIALALALFFVGLALTRIIQRGLKRGPFAHSRLDPGVQESLTTLVGYVGLGLAAVIGVTGLGFNLSNLAIIAGALSVGVGFGLQSIVNNFVSGLILLFERPIKVGDWVVTQSGEGIIRKISVRSTEIETFERSSIIVPNSELISQTVTNWTHKNRIGRITVPVGVAYDSDPEQVRAILLKCAHDHPEIVRFPEPFIVWREFGASALEFELRAFLGDIAKGLQTRTDLRFAIFKAFKEAGIRIPFPQQDVYIHAAPEPPQAPRRAAQSAPAERAPDHEQEDAGAVAPDD